MIVAAGIHGWNSEDRKLVHGNRVAIGGPSVLTGIHQRGWPGLNATDSILWEEQRGSPFAVRDSILNGNVNIDQGGSGAIGSNALSNVIFNEGMGGLITHGPARYSSLNSHTGTLQLVAPDAAIELGPPSGEEHVSIGHGGMELNGMLNLSQGADVRAENSTNSTIVVGTDGNFFRVAGTETIDRVAPGPRSGTQVVLYFADHVKVKDGRNLQLAGDFAATPGSTLSLVALGSDWLELGRSDNGPAASKTDDSQRRAKLDDADLYLHSAAVATKLNARCLDGTRGGFYHRAHRGAAARTKWKLHFMGGGWCWDGPSCLSRASNGQVLGSSTSWTKKLSNLDGNSSAVSGLMAAGPRNPFGDWNMVFLNYCDGSSQTSDRDEPLIVNGTAVHMRGRALLDAHLLELERRFAFLSTATEVVVSGTSAGGMSSFMHSSFIKSQLATPGARLVAVPDAGWWWDHVAAGSTERPWLTNMAKKIVPSIWNATLRGGSGRCLLNPPGGVRAKCFTQPYAYVYLDVPTFVVQSLYDPVSYSECESCAASRHKADRRPERVCTCFRLPPAVRQGARQLQRQ